MHTTTMGLANSEIDRINQEIAELESEATAEAHTLDLRSKQFQLLLYSLAELKRALPATGSTSNSTSTSSTTTTSVQ
jgi:DNA gyrase/topoisomerase IV subunit A